MARVTSTHADLQGTIGNTIIYEVNGEKFARKTPRKLTSKEKENRPPTELQLFHQQKLSLASDFLFPIMEVIEFGYHNFKSGMKRGIHQATSNLMNKALYFNEEEELLVDPAQVMISQGKLTGFSNPSAAWTEEGKVRLQWDNNTGIADAKAKDQVVILLYHLRSKLSFAVLQGNFRSQQQQEILAPLQFQGELHIYIAFSRHIKRGRKFDISDSEYLGVI
ncbi:DUF6266 family protein [Litoribacter populi]|uniref:DUF6266 family protein n=1 Tax=Litoribacter populi TaxID=2598460 RepID=UPI00117DAAB8|nr:DUF6266 family protein [Litoribacter populi]